MPISSSKELHNKKQLPRKALPLIANIRHIPASFAEEESQKLVYRLSDILDEILQKKYKQNTRAMLLENLQDHWQHWFSGTDFSMGYPERMDRWSCLWIKGPNAIVCQKLQFKNVVLLNTLNSLLDGSIKRIRWFF